MLLLKLGILGFLGKQVYLPFVYAHLIQNITHMIKVKINKKLEESACSQQSQELV